MTTETSHEHDNSNDEQNVHELLLKCVSKTKCCYDCVKELLQKGANITARDKYGLTSLHLAVRNNICDVVKCLVDESERRRYEYRGTIGGLDSFPHRRAVNSEASQSSILQQSASWRSSTNNYYEYNDETVRDLKLGVPTLLHSLALTGCTQCAEVLLPFFDDVNLYDTCDHSPLHYAIQERHAKIAMLLLREGARPSDTDRLRNISEGETFLAAIQQAYEEYSHFPSADFRAPADYDWQSRLDFRGYVDKGAYGTVYKAIWLHGQVNTLFMRKQRVNSGDAIAYFAVCIPASGDKVSAYSDERHWSGHDTSVL